MSRSIVARLILKDLYLGRWLIAGTLLAGLVSLAIMPASRAGYYVGSVSLLCVLIVLNLFVTTLFVVSERKDKTHLFVLSLPISTSQYTAAKVAASCLAFLVPWLLLMAGYVAIVAKSSIPDGMIPLALAVFGYLFAYFCVFLAVALVASSGWTTGAIVVGNVAINFVIPYLMSRSSVAATLGGPVPVWTSEIVVVMAIEILGGLGALGVALSMTARSRGFVS